MRPPFSRIQPNGKKMRTFSLWCAVVFLALISNSLAGSGVKATVAAEVLNTLEAGEQLPNGGLLIQVTKVWDWRKGDGSVPIPAESQVLILTDFTKQATAAMGDKYLLRIEHVGLAKAETGEQVRVFKVVEELDPNTYFQKQAP